jgi:hypothetical protein
MTMRRHLVYGAILVAVLCGLLAINSQKQSEAAMAVAPMLAHNVYFTLKDNSAEAKKKFIEACKKYLSKHPGEPLFAVGTRAEDLKREINDQDFDVALQIIFTNKMAHDEYQNAPRHKKFIEENKDNWKKVRVFDAMVDLAR